MKADFSSLVSTAEFSKFAGILSTTLYFRILNNSTGIPSPLLPLFIVMLPKVHLTSHSRMSASRWVDTPSWLLRSLQPFLYSSSVYSCYLFCFSWFLPFLSFIVPTFAWNVLLLSLSFLKKSLVFAILLLFSISLHCSLKMAFLSLLLFFGTLHSVGNIFSFLLCLSPLLFSQLFVRPPQITILLSCIFFTLKWYWLLPPVQC